MTRSTSAQPSTKIIRAALLILVFSDGAIIVSYAFETQVEYVSMRVVEFRSWAEVFKRAEVEGWDRIKWFVNAEQIVRANFL